MSTQVSNRRLVGRKTGILALGLTLALGSAAVVEGALVSGSLPTSGLTYLSVTTNDVNMAGDPIRLKIKDPVNVKTTYSIVTPSSAFLGGWHYHNGPVIVTVTVGTLTFYDSACDTWNVTAGQTYIESRGQVLNAKALPAENSGATAEWFTTRLYPAGTSDPVAVDPPCTP